MENSPNLKECLTVCLFWFMMLCHNFNLVAKLKYIDNNKVDYNFKDMYGVKTKIIQKY